MAAFRYPIEEIRDKSDLVEVISRHVSLKKSGRRLIGLCPFHNEKTPSFFVDPDRNVWKCFGCGEGGDIFSFVQKIENFSFNEAVEQLASKAGIKIEKSAASSEKIGERDRIYRANYAANTFYKEQLKKSDKAKSYLSGRNITWDMVEKFKIGYAPDSWDGLCSYLLKEKIPVADAAKAGLIGARDNGNGFYDRFRDRIIFPIFDISDRVIGFGGRILEQGEPKYLNSPETPVFIKNKILYGLSWARRAIGELDKVIIVEGYMDTVTVQAAGFVNAVATMGTALTEEHAQLIARYTKNVVLAFDADSAGMNAALRSAPIFERFGLNLRIINMPEGEDPDSMLRGGDRSKFEELINKSMPISDFKIKIVLKKHDLKTDEGRTAALRESASILAEIESVMERERLIRHLAKLHPNFSTGTTLAENHIRSETSLMRANVLKQKRGDVDSRSNNIEKNRQNRIISRVEKAERLILAKIILKNDSIKEVFDHLTANEFTVGATKELALAVVKLYEDVGRIDKDKLFDCVASELLTDILIGYEDEELSQPIEGLVEVVLNNNKLEKRKRMLNLAQKLEKGELKIGDIELEEYYKLTRETSGVWRR